MVHRREFLGTLGAATVSRAASAAPARNSRGDPWLELNSANLAWNLRQIRARAGKPVMAVIKANAYGHGLLPVAQALQAAGVDRFLVAKLDEARRLREAGIRGLVFNFGPFSDADAHDIVRLKISQNIYKDQTAALERAARRLGQPARLHVKIDTGLGRFGVPYDQALELIERFFSRPALRIEGVLTTFTEDPEFDAVQLARFKDVCAQAAAQRRFLGLRSAASSAAILDFPAACTDLDMVRPGIMLYGLYPSERAEQERKIDLRPVLAMKSRVEVVKTLRPGESVGYHRVFTAREPQRVATLAVGYSDGLPRGLQGKGSVVIAGRRCPIVAISANATIIQLGDVPAAPGDEVELMGPQIPVSEAARLTGAGVYAVVMGLRAI